MLPDKVQERMIEELEAMLIELHDGTRHVNASLAEMIRMRIVSDMRNAGEIE